MTIYVDDRRVARRVGRVNGRWSHLTADSERELLDFATNVLGLERGWLQQDVSGPFYPVSESKRQLALRSGAVSRPVAEAAHTGLSVQVPPGRTGDPGPDLEVEAASRYVRILREPSPTEVEEMVQRAWEVESAEVSVERLYEATSVSQEFYSRHFNESPAAAYLAGRFGVPAADLGRGGLSARGAGYAPAGWSGLLDHLAARGFSGEEAEAAGLAIRTRRGTLVDRFRDRLMFPVMAGAEVASFVGRSLPGSDRKAPRYLNGPQTAIFAKRTHLYVPAGAELRPRPRPADPDLDPGPRGQIPVIVEGPVDAEAVTVASSIAGFSSPGFVGVASMGTAVTLAHARQLAETGVSPIIATDNDLAGDQAAERAYWMLTRAGVSQPSRARIGGPGEDPAAVFEARGPDALMGDLAARGSLAVSLVSAVSRDETRPVESRLVSALGLAAAADPREWLVLADTITAATGLARDQVRTRLIPAAAAWTADPDAAVAAGLADLAERAEVRKQQTSAARASVGASPAAGASRRPDATEARPVARLLRPVSKGLSLLAVVLTFGGWV